MPRGQIGGLAAGLSLAAGLGGMAIWGRLRQTLPRLEGRLRVDGPTAPLDIHRDRWGVPHIEAQSEADAFFGLGFVHAQDRLWQMELTRRLARGEMAEAFGPGLLELDRFFRRLGLGRAAAGDLERSGSGTRALLDSYAAGVNAHLDLSRARLPVEFELARLAPRPWSTLDTLSTARYTAFALSDNWDQEVQRSRFFELLGSQAAARLEPWVWKEAGGRGKLARGEEAGEKTGERAADRPSQKPEQMRPENPRPHRSTLEWLRPYLNRLSGAGGSNAWAVHGRRTTTGQPLLANDPHLVLLLPSIWYEAHVRGGDLHVTGATLAGVPGVIIGHNERIAWGVTLALVDVDDLFELETDPGDVCRYRYDGEWERADILEESIWVRGRPRPVQEQVVLSRHGPVVTPSPLVPGEDRTLALCSVSLQPAPGIEPLLALNRARGWEEFRSALSNWTVPALNFVYADQHGNVGFQLAARVPVRKAGNGLLPSPGWDSAFGWDGWVKFDELPGELNPARGFVASANNRPTEPGSGPYLGSEWSAPYRHQRISQVLEQLEQVSAADCQALQQDVRCLPGLEVAAYLGELDVPEGDASWAQAELIAWNGRATPDSVGAAIYEVFKDRFLRRRFGSALGDHFADLLGRGIHPVLRPVSNYYMRVSQLVLETLREEGEMPGMRAQAAGALGDAASFLRARLGARRSGWKWGRIHRAIFAHSLGRYRPLDMALNLGPYPIGGDADTLLKTAWLPPGFEANGSCPAYRLICDLSNWDNSLSVLPPGQSGQRLSPHYSDQVRLWLNGDYHPMPFSSEALAVHRRATLRLEPNRG